MMSTPMIPATTFCCVGALTIGFRKAGSAIGLALKPAGDLERHLRRRSREILARNHDVYVLELPRASEVRHESRYGDCRPGRPGNFERGVLLLHGGDPEIGRHRGREGVHELNRS